MWQRNWPLAALQFHALDTKFSYRMHLIYQPQTPELYTIKIFLY